MSELTKVINFENITDNITDNTTDYFKLLSPERCLTLTQNEKLNPVNTCPGGFEVLKRYILQTPEQCLTLKTFIKNLPQNEKLYSVLTCPGGFEVLVLQQVDNLKNNCLKFQPGCACIMFNN